MDFNVGKKHRFHLVDPSPWPFYASFFALFLTAGGVTFFYRYGSLGFLLGFYGVLFCMYVWWRDVIREGTFLGHHTEDVQSGLKIGVILFILSEVMFFFSFFWAFFHSSLAPTIQIGCEWPPLGISVLAFFNLPLTNTVILLLSGYTVTKAHEAIIDQVQTEGFFNLLYTVVLGVLFTVLQGLEYSHALFSIRDSVYGSTFFLTTGFHGLHVLIGSLFLIVSMERQRLNQFTEQHHIGFEAAAWYWHFVDVVWLFLFVMVYWWGGSVIESEKFLFDFEIEVFNG